MTTQTRPEAQAVRAMLAQMQQQIAAVQAAIEQERARVEALRAKQAARQPQAQPQPPVDAAARRAAALEAVRRLAQGGQAAPIADSAPGQPAPTAPAPSPALQAALGVKRARRAAGAEQRERIVTTAQTAWAAEDAGLPVDAAQNIATAVNSTGMNMAGLANDVEASRYLAKEQVGALRALARDLEERTDIPAKLRAAAQSFSVGMVKRGWASPQVQAFAAAIAEHSGVIRCEACGNYLSKDGVGHKSQCVTVTGAAAGVGSAPPEPAVASALVEANPAAAPAAAETQSIPTVDEAESRRATAIAALRQLAAEDAARVQALQAAAMVNTRGDFAITPGFAQDLGLYGPKERYRNNVAAVKLLQQLEAEQRAATSREQQMLAKFTGWGALANVFNTDNEWTDPETAFDDLEISFATDEGAWSNPTWSTATRKLTPVERAAFSVWNSERSRTGKRYLPDYSRVSRAEDWDDFRAWMKSRKPDWVKEYQELKGLLTQDEYRAAKATALNAHYTAAPIAAAMWETIQGLGFSGGTAGDITGCGAGNFLGTIPPDLADKTRKLGVELDPLTARLAQKLYPGAYIQNCGLEQTQFPDGALDVAIGNPPFGAYSGSYDPEFARGERAAIAKKGIHHYMAAKAMQKVKPGGVVGIVISRFFLDGQDDSVRKYLAQQGDLVGAMRLPETAFKGNAGTEVVTDIIYLRKRRADEPPGDDSWTQVAETTASDGSMVTVNKYFADHPEMVLGKMVTETHGMHSKNELTVQSDGRDLPTAIRAAAARLPKFVTGPGTAKCPLCARFVSAEGEGHAPTCGQAGQPVRLRPLAAAPDVFVQARAEDEYAYKLDHDGRVCRQIDGQLVPHREYTAGKGDQSLVIRRVRGLLSLAPLAIAAQAANAENAPDEELALVQTQINQVYDAFVAEFGPVNSDANRRAFSGDPSLPYMMALERYDDATDTWEKEDIFSRRTTRAYVQLDKADTSYDSMQITLDQTGTLDWARMSELTGRPAAALQADLLEQRLVYQTPAGDFQTADEYLSGNVRKKLREAREAAKYNPAMRANAQALEAVLPADVLPGEIQAELGVPWVEEGDVQAFVNHLMGVDARVKVSRLAASNEWVLGAPDPDVKRSVENTQKWGVPGVPALELMKLALNSKEPSLKMKAKKCRKCGQFVSADGRGHRTRPPCDYITEAQDVAAQAVFGKAAGTLTADEKDQLARLQADLGDANLVQALYGGKLIYNLTNAERKRALAVRAGIVEAQTKVGWTCSDEDEDAIRDVVDQERTIEAREKQRAINDEFSRWLWSDDARAVRLTEGYNDRFNAEVLREYDGSHLSMPGLGSAMPGLRPIQKDAVWRGLQDHSTLFALGVGAGKTFVGIGLAHELKRLGKSDLNIITVPKPTLGQWAASYHQMYPGARVLVLQPEDVNSADEEKRKEMLARITTGDYDAIILSHEAYERIPVDDATYTHYANQEIDEAAQVLESRKAELYAELAGQGLRQAEIEKRVKRDTGVKRIQAKIKSLQRKLATRQAKAQEKQDASLLTFEKLTKGRRPHIIVDEIHRFGRMPVFTKMGSVKELTTQESGRAGDMMMKTRYLRDFVYQGESRGLYGLTGTPGERVQSAYLWSRLLAEGKLREMGVESFDAFAKQFGRVVSSVGLKAAGRGYEVQTSFSGIVNAPELQQLLQTFSTSHIDPRELKLPLPQLRGDKPLAVATQLNDEQRRYVDDLVYRAEHLGPPKPGEDNILVVMNDARKSALDHRLIDPNAADLPTSKLNLCVKNALETYRHTRGVMIKNERGEAEKANLAQLIFLDYGTPRKGKAAAAAGQLPKQGVVCEGCGKRRKPSHADCLIGRAARNCPTSPEFLAAQAAAGDEDAGLFDLYGDMKKKLMLGGVKESEIAFWQDAKNDAERMELMRRANRGEIAFVLGTSKSMSEGVNMQRLLKKVHFLSLPQTAATFKQAKGRVERQGNLCAKIQSGPEGHTPHADHEANVECVVYLAEKSMDIDASARLERKADVEHKLWMDKSGERIIQTKDQGAMTFAEFKATSTGDPRMVEMVELDREISDLDVAARRHQTEVFRAKQQLGKLPEKIADVRQGRERLAAAKDLVVAARARQEAAIEAARKQVEEDKIWTGQCREKRNQAEARVKEVKGRVKENDKALKDAPEDATLLQQQAKLAQAQAEADAALKEAEERLENAQITVQASSEALKTDAGFSMTLGKRAFNKSEDAGERLRQLQNQYSGAGSGTEQVGEFMGFPLFAQRTPKASEKGTLAALAPIYIQVGSEMRVISGAVNTPTGLQTGEILGVSGTGNIARVRNALDAPERELARLDGELAELEKQAAPLREVAERSFARADELARKRARREAIESELHGENKGHEYNYSQEDKDEAGEEAAESEAEVEPEAETA